MELYDENGLRTQKTVNGVTTNYYYNGSLLMGMTSGNVTQRFCYDANGSVISVAYNGTYYYYLRNAQGDIVKLIDKNGQTVVEYTYDTWGKVISVTGSLASTLGQNQPFRYRGYVYDNETGWYYLQSRYYDPNTCRFVSADVMLSTGQGVLGHNSFAYCLNNPVNRTDTDGDWSLPNWAKVAIGVAAIAVGVIATVATGGAAAPALVAGVKTALVVGAISAGTSAATTAVTSVINGDDIKTLAKKVGNSAIDGFCDGFMTGGIMSGASMTYGSLLKNANGIKIGSTAKPQYGKVNIGYGNPATNGNTIISIQNKAGKSLFRLEADAVNMLHMHYGATKAALRIHRTGIIRTIAGVLSSVK